MNWNRTEPVRTWLYGLLGPLVALLVAYGLIAEEHASLWTALVTAVLGVAGTEVARRRVSPTA